MAERTYTVSGMTCGHCVGAVTREISQVGGVGAVEVALATGRVRVTGDGFADEQIREAVDEAGYEIVDA